MAVAIVEEWRRSGNIMELAAWCQPLEEASPRLRAAVADANEALAQASYMECPCEEYARQLLRKPAADRPASLEHDREIATRHGIKL